MTDHYMGNPNVKGDGVTQPWTEHDVREYAKCLHDPSYFARTYVKIISLDKGLVGSLIYWVKPKAASTNFNLSLALEFLL